MNGRHLDIPADEYHASPAENRGSVVQALRSIPHWSHYKTQETSESDALRFGRAFHVAALEPELYNPATVDVRTSRSKAFQEFADAHPGQDVLLRWEAQRIDNMLAALAAHDLGSTILTQGHPEVTYIWEDADTGLTCRARTDWEGHLYLADLKSAQDASPRGFAKSCRQYRYDIQAAWYCDGARECGVQIIDGMRFVVVEKAKPHVVQVYDLSPEDVRRGREDYKKALWKIRRAMDGQQVPQGYVPGIHTLTLWAA